MSRVGTAPIVPRAAAPSVTRATRTVTFSPATDSVSPPSLSTLPIAARLTFGCAPRSCTHQAPPPPGDPHRRQSR